MKKFKKLIIGLSPVLIFLLISGFSLIKCEILTLLHGNEFDEVYKVDTMLGDMEYLKVLDYSENQARVYYVSSNYSGGDILTFIKENGGWKYESWNTIWSRAGNADDVIWPYWWHFFYSHPQLKG